MARSTVPARVLAGGKSDRAGPGIRRSCAAARGADIAARCPYHAKHILRRRRRFPESGPKRNLMSLLVASFLGTNLASAESEPKNPLPAVVKGNTAFAVDLYHREKGAGGNLFFSPYSISTALAMTWAGARGQTEQEMARVLHFPLPWKEVHRAFGALGERFDEIQKHNQVSLNVANSSLAERGRDGNRGL